MRNYTLTSKERNLTQSAPSRSFAWRNRREKLFSYLFLLLPLLLVARLTILVRQRSGIEYAAVDSMAALQIGLVLLIGFLFLIAPRIQVTIKQSSNLSVRFFFGYFFLALLSTLWSVNQEYTLYRSVEFIVLFAAIYMSISYHQRFFELEKLVLGVSFLVIILGIGMHLKLSNYSFTLRALHTNSYSSSAAMLFCYCFGEYFGAAGQRKKTLLNWGAISLLCILIGTSSASNIAFLVGVILVTILNRNKLLFLLAVMGILFLTLTMNYEDFMKLIFPGKSEHQIMTFTGRFNIWDFYYNLILKKPFLGYGFSASTKMLMSMTNTHNGYLAVMLGTGAIGMLFFVTALLKFTKEAWLNIRKKVPGSLGCLAAITAALVNNLSLSILGEQWSSSSMTLACFLCFHFWLTARRREKIY